MSAKKAKRLRQAVRADMQSDERLNPDGVFTADAVRHGRIDEPDRKQLARAIRQELRRQSSTPAPAVGETSST